MIHLVFLLEDRSMESLLESFLPRILPPPPDVIFTLIPHEGKADLDRSIPRKLRAWQEPAFFVVLRDQDSADCIVLKQKMKDICSQAGHPETLIRIACKEIESWYLADLTAVDRVFGTSHASKQETKTFRNPDRLGSPSKELEKLVPSFQKVAGARNIGSVLEPTNTRSQSFFHFVDGLQRLLTSLGVVAQTNANEEEMT